MVAVPTRTLNPLPFEALEPKRFEDLIRQLAYDFRPWRMLEATGRAGSDDGFDARGFEIVNPSDPQPDEEEDEERPPAAIEDRLWLIQCKRERSITPAKMQKYLDDLPELSMAGLYGVIFAAACDFSKKTRDVFRAWCRTNGISEAHIWGKAEIEDQLCQPKNDSLLFAYFGISIQIRRRSTKTRLRAKLAMKRKCEKILEHRQWQDVLVIDPEDDRYPYKPGAAATKKDPPRWAVRKFIELNWEGVVLIVRHFYAYIAEDNKGWDYVESIKIGDDERPGDLYPHDSEAWRHEVKVRRFWSDLPDSRQAWLMDLIAIRFEDILDVDEKGDAAYRFPHIFVQKTTPLMRFSIVESLQRFSPARVEPDPATRVKFFPEEFPEPPPISVPA